MKPVDIHVWYNHHGKIIGIGYARDGGGATGRVIPMPSPGQHCLMTQIGEDQLEKLHETHEVDVGAKALVKKSGC